MTNIIKQIGTWIWCFPQQLVGFLVKKFTKARKQVDHYEFSVKCGSISLGTYVFLCPAHWGSEDTLRHERGHTKQSYMLGWLYVPIILIPSMIWAGCFNWYRKKYNVSYYSFYTEKWANKIAGIDKQ